MFRYFYFLGSVIKWGRCRIGILFLLSLIAFPAAADYIPPEPSPPPGPTGSHARRGGCIGDSDTELTAIAPQTYVGQTINSHPTFSWYIPDTESFNITFRLYEYSPYSGRQEPAIYSREEFPSSFGMMTLTLPQDQPGLTTRQQYLWQVIVECNRNSPSSSLVAGAFIEVNDPASFAESLAVLEETPLGRADQYGGAGLWYDAWAELMLADETTDIENARPSFLEDLIESEVLQLRQVLEGL